MANQVVVQQKKFSVLMQEDSIKKLVNSTLGDPKKAERFTAAIISSVAVNPALQECEGSTILSSALLGESLSLSPSPQLGHYYIVPFKKKGKNKEPDTKVATFQLGYKGYIQLAIRSGQYKTINVINVKEGEYVYHDLLTEEVKFDFITDEDKREEAKTIGYCAVFELVNGFKKTIYWTYKKMISHADRYSPAFSKEGYDRLTKGLVPFGDQWKYSSYWYNDFDGMAYKTMLRQLISKWGIMSIEMQNAFENDMSFKDEMGNVNYVDNPSINYSNVSADIEVHENSNVEEFNPKVSKKMESKVVEKHKETINEGDSDQSNWNL